jgi:hypothetical protein
MPEMSLAACGVVWRACEVAAEGSIGIGPGTLQVCITGRAMGMRVPMILSRMVTIIIITIIIEMCITIVAAGISIGYKPLRPAQVMGMGMGAPPPPHKVWASPRR